MQQELQFPQVPQFPATEIHLNGLIFDLNGNRCQPSPSMPDHECELRSLESNSKLITFLRMLDSHDLLRNVVNEGKIIYADDQVINHKLLEISMQEAGVTDRLTMFGDG